LLVRLLEAASLSVIGCSKLPSTLLRDRAESISTSWLYFYRVTLPIIAFHVVTEYGPETPDPFSPLHFRSRPPTRKKGLARETRPLHGESKRRTAHVGEWGAVAEASKASKATCICITRNTHTHLCLAPMCRLCVRIICSCKWSARGKCYVCCRPRRCLVSVVSKPQWPRHAIIPDLHLHHQRTLSSTHLSESSISERVRLCDAHVAYTYGM